jgi:hypothetical protein
MDYYERVTRKMGGVKRRRAGFLPSSRTTAGKTQACPLCPYPSVARWDGKGLVDDAASYSCAAPKK